MRLTRVVASLTAVVLTLSFAPVARAQHDAPRTDSSWPTRVGTLGCPAPVWGQGEGERVLVLGDSLTREGRKPLTRLLRAKGWNPTIRCWGGTRLDWARDQIREAKRADQLPSLVVVALGTNDMRWIDRSRTRARMQSLVDAIGPQRRILWVDTYASGGDRFTKAKQRWFNNEVRRLARENPNVVVAPWGEFAKRAKVRFRDALHYNAAGERAWAGFVADALHTAFAR